ncbi:sensor histidine kinase [Croceicoccus ponticola]|uniref:histidine kinase n=1 Tax=Croceicoccus ponticola TaxID=2217664 RepID=A0A437GWY6_9SPHN|nr:sensor histidine kinase [Croceicoccus ponticola]RVQ66905.1 sensor histidine kinase [Croceicoccus ponticola]
MHRLASYDVSSRFRSPAVRLAAEALFGLVCALTMIGLRSLVDVIAPSSGPFALVYPTVLIATLFGHWRGGLVAYLISFFWAWWYVLPTVGSFEFEVPNDASRVAINLISVAVVAVFAEAFRRAVKGAAIARDAEIERRGMLLAELEHRTKNNFALVASLLELQKRRTSDAAVADAIEQATGRVHTFARAYANLVDSQGEGASVEMENYLHEVVGHMHDGAFDDGVQVTCHVEPCILPRQVAVAIGLFVNEALTNCAKYAFPEGRVGRVEVAFARGDADWSVSVRDNGIGLGDGTNVAGGKSTNGMGAGLMQAFACQAGATYAICPQEEGHCVRMESVAA